MINLANNIEFDLQRLLVLFFFGLNGIVLSHILRYLILKLDIINRKPLENILFVLFGCTGIALVFQLFYEIIQSTLTEHKAFSSIGQFFAQSAVMLIVFASWALIYLVNHYVRALRKNEIDNLKLTSQKQQIELALMRSQLNPHFLFNSLNSIKALISDQPQEAKVGVTKLSNLLRSILIYSRRESVTVEEELNFVRDYLDLEKIRFEDRLQYEQHLIGNPEQVQLPPMTIQSLVENAVKHGINNLKNGGKVEIRVEKSNNQLTIEVINDGNLQHKTDTGVGLANTVNRLKQTFNNRAQLLLSEENQKVSAKIIIPL